MEKVLWQSYNAFTTKKGNIVWAAAMQLAWSQLREKFASNQPLAFLTEQPAALATINNFNLGAFKRTDIKEKDVYVKSGYGMAALDTINKEVKAKFPQKQIPNFQANLHDTDIISYAYLFKQIVFGVKFEKREEKDFMFAGKKVRSFWAKEKAQLEQVKVHDYQDRDNFIIEIPDKKGDDSLFLIKSPQDLTVDEAVRRTMKAGEKRKGSALKKGDSFMMPIVNLDQERSFKEMIGLPFANPELKEYLVAVMVENIKLQVNEAGAKVENQAVIVATRSACMVVDRKEIVLDRPFWLVMKEAGKHPYLCAFINHPQD